MFLFAYLAGLTHILLDFTNNYGVRPFWPFWEKWYSWDIVFIVEPLLLMLLIGGLVVPGLFSLINDEIGVRRKGPAGRLAATLALMGVIAVWGVRDYEHRRAVNALDSRLYDGGDPVRVSAYPNWLESISLVWRGRDPEISLPRCRWILPSPMWTPRVEWKFGGSRKRLR